MDYYIGLDMGTNSVGWAVTDPQYRLLRRKGKDMWGIREFDEAEPAAERRTYRIRRRARQRSRVRIGLLKEIFHDAIMEEDPNFYARMENSFYKAEDKDSGLSTVDGIFADEDYHDADYYGEYPTIFHLKYDLISDRVPRDNRYARKVYLALHNDFKHRGHFLNESLSGTGEGGKDVWQAYLELSDILEQELEVVLPTDAALASDFRSVFSDEKLSRTGKRERLQELLSVTKKDSPQAFLVLAAICGLKIDFGKLLSLETEEKAELDFSSAGFEETVIYTIVGDSHAGLVEAMKQVYDAGVLVGLMSGTDMEGNPIQWLSQARVNSYEKHKKDLHLLKKCIYKYCGAGEYDYLFREDVDDSYSAYVGSVAGRQKARRGERLHGSKAGERYNNLKKRLKKDLAGHEDDVDVKYILEELERETFLPKQLTFANGVIPNQLHEREVRKILENASVTLPFLSEVGADGISNQEKIIRLFTFRLPYFIGPVSRNIGREDYKGNGWAVRREGSENDVVYPWNIENVIDYDATRAEFITRMVRECSYLAGEKVLPKESMEYQAFMVLNTINNIRINGEKISCALKQDIYHDVFEKKGGRITKKKILEYLNHRGIAVEEKELSGIDTTIGCQLSTYQRFHGVFGENMAKDSVRHMVEDIVFKGTVYGESKAMLKEMLQSTYEDMLTEQQLKRVLGFKYRDWGNLSKAFLELEGCNCETGEAISLIRALWEDEDNLNMMELLHSEKYTFSEVLKEKHQSCMKPMTEFTYQDLDEMYFSAPVKRMIWQTLLLIREITEVLGCYPKKIFVEMTRTEEEKKGDAGRKDSREKELLNLYKFIKDDRSWDEEIREAGSSGRLRSKKLYLYYKQMGRDMYTGLPIDLQELFDDNKYDIDHIYPRHYVKDDSIHNNLVLVDKRKNSRKSDNYPLDEDIRKKETPLWNMLHEKGFLNDEKYRRLTGSRSFTEEQKADFIARQLVETGQATKGVNDLLKEILPEGTRLVYSKAGNVSDFRRDFGFYKSRIINDFHHAHDAYLNIVVGNVYDTKFTTNPLNFIKNERTGYHMGKMFDRDVVRNGYMAWQAPIRDDVTGEVVDAKESLTMVRTMLAKNTPLMTRLTRPQQGKLSEATIYCATDAKEGSYLPLKSKNDRKREDVTKYGGLKSIQNAYCFLVEHEVVEGKGKNKGKTIKVRTLEYLPIYKRAEVEGSADGLLNYCLELGLKNPSIRLKKINPKSLMVVNGFPVCLAGKNQSQFSMENACNLILQPQWTEYIHFIDKSNRICRLSQEITAEKNLMLYDELVKKHTEGIFAKRPNPIGEKLKKDREKFMELSAERQILVLTEILKLSSIGSISSSGANLKDIGESPSTGTIKLNRNISKLEQCKLVHTSVTGLFEKEVDLLTV